MKVTAGKVKSKMRWNGAIWLEKLRRNGGNISWKKIMVCLESINKSHIPWDQMVVWWIIHLRVI